MTDLEMIRQVHQAIFGLSDTDEKGMVGDIKDIKKTVADVCSDQTKLKIKVGNLIWFLAGTGLLAGGTLIKLLTS